MVKTDSGSNQRQEIMNDLRKLRGDAVSMGDDILSSTSFNHGNRVIAGNLCHAAANLLLNAFKMLNKGDFR